MEFDDPLHATRSVNIHNNNTDLERVPQVIVHIGDNATLWKEMKCYIVLLLIIM